ncbi:MAG: phosphoglycerate mutase, partial [Magnetococcales bacterium]|nr:phosphoglycerate mutase [Magnetococcales bacterium]
MILARHPVNLRREREGRLSLNTPWLWGGGPAPEASPPERREIGALWSADATAAGLVRWRGGE